MIVPPGLRPSTPPCDGGLCDWVYDVTDSEDATLAVNWFFDGPFTVIVIVVAALIVARVARRSIQGLVDGYVGRERSSLLDRVGVETPNLIRSEPDPRRLARANSLRQVLTSSATVVVWSIAVLMILGVVGVDLAPLLAGAGIAGVALGFGAQTLVKDCIAGFFMLLEDQYGIGDVVDLGEATGVVEAITLRVTVLRSLDGTVWHVPNGVVQRVGNKSQLWSVALVDVDVAYDTDLGAAQELLLEAITEVCDREAHRDEVIEPPAVLGVEALAADGVTLRATTKVVPGAQWNLQREMRAHVKSRFDAAGIEIPFPQRTLWMRHDGGSHDTPGSADRGLP